MKRFDFSLFDEFVPVKYLSNKDKETLLEHIDLVTYEQNQIVFNLGENDNKTCYLCNGVIELITSDGSRFEITSAGEDSGYPLSNFQPRQYSARAVVQSSVLVIRKDILDELMEKNNISSAENYNGMEVTDLDSLQETDWMSYLLGSRLFRNIPAHNIQNIFSRIESIELESGDYVIRQGEVGEYFYIIKQGKCEVSRKPSVSSPSVKMSRLVEGNVFGEETLITGEPGSVSVRMLTDGELLRLHREDFNLLIYDEIIHGIHSDDAMDLEPDNTVYLDVGYPDEIITGFRPDTVNIPLNLLGIKAGKLDKDKEYIVFCAGGIKSKVAVFLLVQHGIRARYIKNVIETLQSESARNRICQGSVGSNKSECGLNTVPVAGGYNQVQEQRALIGELKSELEELKDRLDNSLKRDKEESKAIAAAEKKAEETIKKEYQLIRETMSKALSIYEETRSIKEKLLEDRLALRNLIENQKKRQEEAVHSIELEARLKISGELKKIEEFYAVKEKQIRQLQKLKSIADKRLQAIQMADTTVAGGKIGKNTINARMGILRDSNYRLHVRNLKRQETENLADEIKHSKEQLKSLTETGDNLQQGRKVDIDELNKTLKHEFEQCRNSGLNNKEINGLKADEGGNPVDQDISDWRTDRNRYENSADRLRELKEKREVIRRIYEHSMKNKTLSKIHDKKLISELNLVLDRNNEDED